MRNQVRRQRKQYTHPAVRKAVLVARRMDGSVDMRGKPVNMGTTGRWKAASFLMGAEILERIAFFGIASNLVTYLTTQLHEDTASSATNVYNWQGASFLLPLIGAFVADAYLGRFWTMINSSVIYVLGMFILTLSVSIPALKPPPCSPTRPGSCKKATTGQLCFFYLGLVLVAIALGGVKPVMAPLGADQFDEHIPRERKMKLSFFNCWFVCLSIGALIAQTALVYIEDNVGWGWGFGIPTAGYGVALAIMYFAGTRFSAIKDQMAVH